ncbi:MAG: YceI family protein [Bacteroidia bacterium]|nr:YceI family protein [Bacteroidia bacterium]
MKAALLSGAVIATVAFTPATKTETVTWKIDTSHTKVAFSVTHMMISETTGKFKIYEGKVSSTGTDFQNASVEFSVDVNSINTDDENRDKHLKSEDFFHAEKYPKMTFKSKSFKKEKGNNYKLTGDLTIRDVTKTVTFDVVHNGTVKSPWGQEVAGFKLSGKINRVEYGLKWNALLEAGGMTVSEEVQIHCAVELIKDKK